MANKQSQPTGKSALHFALGVLTAGLVALALVGVWNLVETMREPKQVPMAATAATVVAGAQIYREDCAACHGLPGQPRTSAAEGLVPSPPQFFARRFHPPNAAAAARFAQRRSLGSYVTTRDGVPLTAMPSFRRSLSDDQIWEVSLLLGQAQNLPPAAAAVLTARAAAAAALSPAPAPVPAAAR